jgi:hyperosmotically inducible periplasmic protein
MPYAATACTSLTPHCTKEHNMKIFNRNLLAATVLGAALAVGCTGLGEKSLGETVDDAAIVSKAKAAFALDHTVKAMDVKVVSYKGDVQLSGIAKSPEEARRAEEIVRALKDVRSVKNDIRLVRN